MMFKKILLASSNVPESHTFYEGPYSDCSPNSHYAIDYYLVENDQSYVNENNHLYQYGVCVSKKNSNLELEESMANYLSDSKSDIQQLIEILCKNQVTPITLPDVLNDLSKNL